jgi:hypothetical protein
VLESNQFMDMEVEPCASGINSYLDSSHRVKYRPIARDKGFLTALSQQMQTNGIDGVLRVKDFSRLWQYRNGESPEVHVRRNTE